MATSRVEKHEICMGYLWEIYGKYGDLWDTTAPGESKCKIWEDMKEQ